MVSGVNHKRKQLNNVVVSVAVNSCDVCEGDATIFVVLPNPFENALV